MINGKTAVNPRHAERIAIYLKLPRGYFPEAREAAVARAIHSRPKLRDTIYFEHLARPTKSRPKRS
jgi:hypothetical protein